MSDESFLSQLKRALVGAPIPSHEAHHERLSKVTGLAVLSSDALSSVAYATEEILRVLLVGGVAALALVTPIGFVIAITLAIVVFSYRQTIHAYPSGGGAYIVAKENLGTLSSLVAAASLLIDYVLTVAVSVAAGVAALTSAFPQWVPFRVEIALGFVAILTVGNLRGVRESGRIFAVPTYFFIVSVAGMLGLGAWRYFTGMIVPPQELGQPATATGLLTTFVLLTAFSNGCTAMTGVEAVSNGVPAFRPPESRNAASTLVVMGVLSIVMFVGITLLTHAYALVPNDGETIVSQLARVTFGGGTAFYFGVQAATMLILVLAANTAYADFPRLASIVARDRFLPRQFTNQGDRLAFSNGILILSALAAVLLVAFGGDTHSLIPLYMIGVFVSFTLSQAGMVIHWRETRGTGWRSSALVNGLGAVVTAIVLVIVSVTKAAEGAWLIILMIPALVTLFAITRRHYDHVATELTLMEWEPEPVGRHVVLGSPYRSLIEPLLDYIAQIQRDEPAAYVTVILPEFVPRRLWQHLLHNQHALLIKGALLFKPNVVVTSVPFHLGRRGATDGLA